MKNFMKIALVVLFSLSCAVGNVFAEDGSSSTSKDWSVTVGLKTWMGTWDPHNMVRYRSDMAAENVVLGSGTVTALYKDYFVSYGQTQSASTEQISFTVNNNGSTTKYNASRTESDIALGYYVNPSWSLMIGQKNITNDFQPAVAGQGTASSYQFSGPVIGATYFNSFENSKLVGYGTLVIGSLTPTITPAPTGSVTSQYMSAELGFVYPLSDRFRVTTGLKVQSQNLIFTSLDAYDSTTKGVMVGGSYTF